MRSLTFQSTKAGEAREGRVARGAHFVHIGAILRPSREPSIIVQTGCVLWPYLNEKLGQLELAVEASGDEGIPALLADLVSERVSVPLWFEHHLH